MRFGLELLSYVYSAERASVAARSLTSLAKTNTDGLEKPLLQITYRSDIFKYDTYLDMLKDKFEVLPVVDDGSTGDLSLLWVQSMDKLLDKDVTHLTSLFDDFVYNPNWLQQLYQLIERHPYAKGWSVYRSSYTVHHRILGSDGSDVLMSMHDGIGTVTKEEWNAYKNQHNNCFYVDAPGGGCTPDIHLAYVRPGDRWATGRDYMENLGVHKHLGRLDQAIDFVGE